MKELEILLLFSPSILAILVAAIMINKGTQNLFKSPLFQKSVIIFYFFLISQGLYLQKTAFMIFTTVAALGHIMMLHEASKKRKS